MKKCGIYGIRNMANGKWYIGQSVDVERRKRFHISYCLRGAHCNVHLQSSFNKYGVDNFEFRILEETEAGLLDIQERLWIKHYKSDNRQFGYNLDGGGNIYKHISEETRKKMSDIKKGRLPNNYGKHLSDETCQKMSDKKRGRHPNNYGKHYRINKNKGKQ